MKHGLINYAIMEDEQVRARCLCDKWSCGPTDTHSAIESYNSHIAQGEGTELNFWETLMLQAIFERGIKHLDLSGQEGDWLDTLFQKLVNAETITITKGGR